MTVNPYAYQHIWPRIPTEDVLILTCSRCNTAERFWATHLTAGNGLADILTWANQHTAGDCQERPRLRPPPAEDWPPFDRTPPGWARQDNGGHRFNSHATCDYCHTPYENITKPCGRTPR